MAEINGTIKLNALVDGFLYKAQRPKEEFKRMHSIAVDGIRELNMLHTNEGRKTVSVTMDGDLSIPFPDDMIGFVAVGVSLNHKYWFFTKDESILDPELRDTDYAEDGDYDQRFGYGVKGAVNIKGYYKVDYKKRRILFRNVDRDDVLLAYTSANVNIGEETYIPVMFKQALESYMAYEGFRYVFDFPQSRIAQYKDMYDTEINKLNLLQSSTIEEWYDTVYGMMSQTPIR